MSSIIKIEDFWKSGRNLCIGLSIQSSEKFPLVVGCSFQNESREIVDIPARYLLSPGLALWGQESANHQFKYPRDAQDLYEITGWKGRIIFALYLDSTFKNRLADTGWVEWNSFNRIGGSTAGLDDEDEIIGHAIKVKYLGRKKEVWTSLEDISPVDIWKSHL